MKENISHSDTSKYKTLNAIIRSMEFESDVVVVPAIELIDMIQAIRMYQQQIAQLKTPEWVNDNLDRLKEYTDRHFAD